MQRARTFLYAAAGPFLVALAYYLGMRSAQPQAGGTLRLLSPNGA